MNKTILVTGGCGFVGSHLCKRIIEGGDRVICLDNLSTGAEKNVAELMKDTNFSLIRQDITRPIEMEFDQVYNLACPASPLYYQKDPIQTVKTNVIGTLNVLAQARKNGAKVLQASTSEIYGDPLVHPQKEDYCGNVSSIGIRACYDEGKRVAETLCVEYWRQYGTDIRIVRIFNTYGPQMKADDGRVVSNFIIQALGDKDITIYGDGSQTRAFQYIDDLLAGMIKMMNNQQNFIGPVNIGNSDEFTVKELAEKVLGLIPESKSRIVYRDLPKDDPKQRRPDVGLAKEKLDWSAMINLDEGLQKTIEWFKREKEDNR